MACKSSIQSYPLSIRTHSLSCLPLPKTRNLMSKLNQLEKGKKKSKTKPIAKKDPFVKKMR